MDWIQIYTAAMIFLALAVAMFQHGNGRSGYHDFRVDFIALLLGLPFYGRVFGWW